MRHGAAIALLVGLGLFIALIVGEGAGDIAAALAAAGWGMVVVGLFHVIPLLLDSAALRVVLPWRRSGIAGYAVVVRARWVGEAVNNLLPVAQMGGLLVMVRLLTQRGHAAATAGAAVTVSTTQQMLSQALFAMIGALLLAAHSGSPALLWSLVGCVALFGSSAAWFYYLQRRGLFEKLARMLARVAGGRAWLDLTGGAVALDEAVHEVYREGPKVHASFGFNLAGWVAGTGEIWLALYYLGHPIALMDALFLEALGQALRGMAFIIPGALGVQEGGYVLLGGLVGLPPDTALALSLIKRVRELMLGLPGLLYWQWQEGRLLRHGKRVAARKVVSDSSPHPVK